MPKLLRHETFTEEIWVDPRYIAQGLGALAMYLAEQSPENQGDLTGSLEAFQMNEPTMSNSGGRERPGEGGPLPPPQEKQPRKPPEDPKPHP